jgi:hypothetical protein
MGSTLKRLFVLAFAVSACGKPQSAAPTVPTPVPVATAAPNHVFGFVEDSALRPLAGVSVVIADGPQSGASATSTDNGEFEISGTSQGSVTLRATKDGFAAITLTASWRPVSDRTLVKVDLEPIGPSLEIEPGNYTISIAADRLTSSDGAAPCAGFPDALLSRSYPATIVSQPTYSRFFIATLQLNNPAPFPTSLGFGLGVAGSAIGFTIDGPEIFEALPAFTYLEIAGSAPTDVPATASGSSISIPFSGSFEYCALKSPMGRTNNCFTTPGDQKIAYAQCLSNHDLMVLTKR